MVSEKVLTEIEQQGMQYIVGVKMRKLKTMDGVLSRAGRYQEVKENLRVKKVKHQGNRYIICQNPEETLRDQKTREAILANLQQKLQEGLKGLVGNRGYRRYLKVEGAKATLDEVAIADEAKYDGKYVLRTNTELPTAEVALAGEIAVCGAMSWSVSWPSLWKAPSEEDWPKSTAKLPTMSS